MQNSRFVVLNSLYEVGSNDLKTALKKEYSGTFKDGILDIISTFDDGAIIKYDGKLENGLMKVFNLNIER